MSRYDFPATEQIQAVLENLYSVGALKDLPKPIEYYVCEEHQEIYREKIQYIGDTRRCVMGCLYKLILVREVLEDEV